MPEAMKSGCNIRELARHVGLSTCTVSKVLNNCGDFKIQPETRRRVLDAARELNYVPNINARRLFRKKSGIIGFLVPSRPDGGNVFADPHVFDLLGGFERPLKRHGYSLLLQFCDDSDDENRYLNLFRAGGIDGLLIWGAHRSDRCFRPLLEAGVPHLFLTSFPDRRDDGRISFVAAGYRAGAEEVTKRLIGRGARRILYLAGPENNSPVEEMNAGVEAAVAAVPGAELFRSHGPYVREDTRRRMKRALQERIPFDSIIGASSFMAPEIDGELRSRKLDPGAFLLGFLDAAVRAPRPLCPAVYVTVDDIRLGEAALDGIRALVEHPDTPVRLRLPMTVCEERAGS